MRAEIELRGFLALEPVKCILPGAPTGSERNEFSIVREPLG